MIMFLVVLLVCSVYFSARFFILSQNIKKSTEDFKEIGSNLSGNRQLKLTSPDKNFEKFIGEINEYIGKVQIEKIKQMRREEEMRKEIENISHDLRTPLTSIRGYLELMNDDEASEVEKQEYLSIVEKRSKGLQNLIQNFYDLSRIEADEYKMNIEKLDINKILKDQLLGFYNDLEKRNLDIEIDLDEDKLYVDLDKNSIDRVFTNLIQNAIKYSHSKFKVSTKRVHNEVILSFENDNMELKKEDEKYLFNRFYMKDSSRNHQSSGLGLTVSKLLVEAMMGSIDVKIEENNVKFIIRFIY